MAGDIRSSATVGTPATPDHLGALVRTHSLKMFIDVVSKVGGEPMGLLAQAKIDPAVLQNPHAMIPYRVFARLVEHAAVELRCTDFGMRLADAQEKSGVLGPLDHVMRNAPTLRDAFRSAVGHIQVHFTGSRLNYEEHRVSGGVLLRAHAPGIHNLLVPQLIERGRLLSQRAALTFSGGRVLASQVWFMHDRIAPLATYHRYFGAPVYFNREINGLVFHEDDLDVPNARGDEQIYEMVTSYIEHRYPANDTGLASHIRPIIEQLLPGGRCTHGDVAATLGMHARTVQRRLEAEGASFESIKDSVRREIALRQLRQPSVTLIQIAQMLGYSETSALSRSCHRWFSSSPRELRRSGAVNGLQ